MIFIIIVWYLSIKNVYLFQIVYDTPFYYSDCAIYPAGFYATRTYAHFRNIFSKCTYHCKVIKAGLSPRLIKFFFKLFYNILLNWE